MSEHEEFQMPTPDAALERLGFLTGNWKVEGTITPGPFGGGGHVTGTASYRWLEGGFFLVHRWEGSMTMDGMELQDSGYEFYDYDPATGQYRTHFFNNLGPYDEAGSKYHGTFEGDSLIVTGPARITRRLNEDGTVTVDSEIAGPDGAYVPFLATTLTKID